MTERIRVAHCIETMGSGGVEQCRLTLAQRLDPARYDQIIICTQAFEDLPDRFEQAHCPVKVIGVHGRIWNPQPYKNAAEVLKAFRAHIVHGGVYEGVATAAIAGRMAGVPVIIGEETSDPAGRRPQGHLLFRALAGLTHHMVAVSPAVGRYLTAGIKLPARKVSVINNGVIDPPPATGQELAELRTRLGLAPTDRVLGTVGRLQDAHKRVSDLIRTLPALRQRFPNIKLLVVGDGKDRGMLEGLAQELGVREATIFVGYQSRTRPFLELMDVFALASASEAFGLVLVEAMFARRPVVATRVGGIPDVVADGETGLLVEPLRPDALATAIGSLLADPARSAAVGEAGLHRATEQFGADRYVSDIDALYQRMLQRRGVR